MITPNQYALKKYPLAVNYQIIAKEAYADGLLANANLNDLNKLKKEIEKLKKENKELNDLLHDDRRLADWICGG